MPDKDVVFYAVQDDPQAGAPFNRTGAVSGLNGLTSTQWIKSVDGMRVAALVDQIGSPTQPTYLRFIRVRDDGGFSLDAAKNLTPVQIAGGAEPAEFIHMVLWPDGYLGARASRDAPPVRYLSSYLAQAAQQRSVIPNLYDAATIQRLKQLKKGGLRKVELRIKNSPKTQAVLDQDAPWLGGIFSMGAEAEIAKMTVTFDVGRSQSKTLDDDVADEIESLAMSPDMLDVLGKLVVYGKNAQGSNDKVDMRRQRLVQTVQFPADLTQNGAAYAAIEAARTSIEQVALLSSAVNG